MIRKRNCLPSRPADHDDARATRIRADGTEVDVDYVLVSQVALHIADGEHEGSVEDVEGSGPGRSMYGIVRGPSCLPSSSNAKAPPPYGHGSSQCRSGVTIWPMRYLPTLGSWM